MYGFWIFISGAGLVLLLMVMAGVLCPIFENRWHRKKLLTWTEKVEALSDDTALASVSTWSYRNCRGYAKRGSSLAVRAEAAHRKILDACKREDARQVGRWITEETSPGKKAEYLYRYLDCDPRLVAGVGKKAYARLFFELLDQALASGRVGMTRELEYYHWLMSVRSTPLMELAKRAGREIGLPEDWDDIVLSQYKNPPTDMFDRYADLDVVDVRTLAGQALVARDVVKAKVALAYCTNSPSPARYSEAVTDALKGDLILLIEGHEFSQHD